MIINNDWEHDYLDKMIKSTARTDIEAQPTVVAQGYPILDSAANAPVYTCTPTTIYVIETHPTQEYVVDSTELRSDPRPEMLLCAIIGLALSWIPIVGFATFLLNMDAPRGTLRNLLVGSACCISSLTVFLGFLFLIY